MNILICGAGEVGRHAAEVLGAEGANITVIDSDADKLARLDDVMDVRSLHGNGTQAEVLIEAGCDKADVFLAATNIDEINLLSAAVAAAVGAHRTIARVHHSAFYEQRGLDYDTALGIDHLVCPEHATALAIAQTLRAPGALAVERFARDQIEMQQIVVSQKAPAVGKPLVALGLPDRSRIAMIERGESVFIPDGQTQIHADDIVTVVADSDAFARACKLLHTDAAKRKHVMILGGTAMGVWLCRALRSQRFAVRLIEADRERAEELATKLDWVTVLRADPADVAILQDERIDLVDAFVALTDDDEHNVLAAAHAKSQGAKTVVAVQKRLSYRHLLDYVGIDESFSPAVTAVAAIKELTNVQPLRHLATLARGVVDVYEVHVRSSSGEGVDIPLRELKLPPKTLVGAIQRDGLAHVPVADDVIKDGDTVVVIGPEGITKDLKRIFATQ